MASNQPHFYHLELAPRVFYKLRNLKTLDLSENHLQFLNGAVFADVPNLETLTCEGCGVFQVRYLVLLIRNDLNELYFKVRTIIIFLQFTVKTAIQYLP